MALAAFVASAGAERAREENVEVSLDGGLTPRLLPRHQKVPVAVHLEGGVRTVDEAPLPRVNRLKLELGWRGHLNTHGLPVCPIGRLRGRSTSQVAQACGESLVGHGKIHARIYVPGQPDFAVGAHLLAFNGRTAVGRRAILVHAYTSEPPISFVIPFVVHRSDGQFPTILVTTIRRAVGTWPHVSQFHVEIGRKFIWKGQKRSYLNASCPAPKGFTEGFSSFARATYVFAGGDELETESVRGCHTR
jgi:hypothetical protein